MKVLVIGASSFVGAYVINELLNHNIEVIGTGRNPKFDEHYKNLNVPYLHLDICKPEMFKILDSYEFDAVICCAALLPANVKRSNINSDNIIEYLNVNVIGTYNILEYCRKHSIFKLISLGSQFDTKLHDKNEIITEGTALNFSYTDDHAAYVISNNGKYQILKYYNENYGMKNVFIRLPTILGVGPHGSFNKNGIRIKSGLQIFIEKATNGEDIEIFGDPNTSKDILYVKDLAVGICQALQSPNCSGLYNMGYDINFSLIDIVKAVVTVFSPKGKKSNIIMRPDKPNNGGFPHMSIEKAKKDFGFTPKYSSFESIMEDYKQELNKGIYSKLFGE